MLSCLMEVTIKGGRDQCCDWQEVHQNASDMKQSSGAEKIDSSLTDYPAWTMGLAVFPLNKVDSVADYELVWMFWRMELCAR